MLLQHLGRAAGDVGAAQDWTAHNGGADESAYSRLDQVSAANVGRLGLAWSLDLPGESSMEATPLAVDGVLYFTGSYAAVYAVDGVTGKLLWKYDPETWKHYPDKMLFGFGANRGVAYADGRIFSAAHDGRLLALDPKNGPRCSGAQKPPTLLRSITSQVRRAYSMARSLSETRGRISARGAM